MEREKKKKQNNTETQNQNKIIMDHIHRLRCFGTIPKIPFLLLLSLLLFSFVNASFDLATIPFNDGYSPLFGASNVVRSEDGYGVQLRLDRYTGKIDS